MYIYSYDYLRTHPKVRRLSRLLSTSRPTAIGHLHCLWWWCMAYAPDGELGRYDADEIAEGSMWEGEPSEFLDSLVDAGFVERDPQGLRVHDWSDYAGKIVERRAEDAARKREARKTSKGIPDEPLAPQTDVRQMSVGCPQDVSRARAGESQSESESESESESQPESNLKRREDAPSAAPCAPGRKPACLEVAEAYFATLGHPEQAKEFWLYFEGNGWVQGRTPLKNWHMAAQKWSLRQPEFQRNGKPHAPAAPIPSTIESLLAEEQAATERMYHR